jgi:hypothetical protein
LAVYLSADDDVYLGTTIATSTGGRKTTAFNRIVNELLRKQEAEQHKDGDPFIVRLRFSIQLLGSL